MKSERLDKLFDEAIERTRNANLGQDPYGMGPLAADHSLLKKSWEYFKKRVNRIDTQYQEIINAKEEEAKALKKTIAQLKDYIGQLESKSKEFDKWQNEISRVRANDYTEFQKGQHKVQQAWQDERISLEEKLDRLEFKVKQSEEKLMAQKKEAASHEKQWIERIGDLRTKLEDQIHQLMNKEREHLEQVRQVEEEVAGRDHKVELLRREIERRDLSIHEMSDERLEAIKKAEKLDDNLLNSKKDLVDRDKEIENLKMKIDILTREKEFIRESWQKEQAEWRELWERDRETWERQREQIKNLKFRDQKDSG